MEEHKAAIELIKKALLSSPFLHYQVYDGKAQFVIQTDASTTAIKAILYQDGSSPITATCSLTPNSIQYNGMQMSHYCLWIRNVPSLGIRPKSYPLHCSQAARMAQR
uniref:Reverse transcriptase/retrotransposon-derived protein RNase H-like domain-containing protein n=1 Tax=Romanomermis culicivorax TaxID=13658 RepID=A0A915JRE2_ROMCU